MNRRDNLLRTVRFETPETIPMVFHINPACWQHYPHDALQELMAEHPLLFPGFTPTDKVTPTFSPVQRRDQPYLDPWGCVWRTSEDGITGVVTEHPLADWDALAAYRAPDPEETDGLVPIDWQNVALTMQDEKARGNLVQVGLRHGHTFLQLCDIRGYQALMFDMADDEPRLRRLIGMLEDFNLAVVERYVAAGAEWMSYPDDLGMQVGPMISPRYFRKYITPSYRRLMRPALDAGCIVHMHSDGDIRLLVDGQKYGPFYGQKYGPFYGQKYGPFYGQKYGPFYGQKYGPFYGQKYGPFYGQKYGPFYDMVGSGVQVVNLQDRVNGIDWIAGRFAGRVCIELDIDRQEVTPKGRPEDIDALIREEVERLGRREGGLMMIYGLYPGVPLENVAALMDAMERHAICFSGG